MENNWPLLHNIRLNGKLYNFYAKPQNPAFYIESKFAEGEFSERDAPIVYRGAVYIRGE
jgi:hypothetical protein